MRLFKYIFLCLLFLNFNFLICDGPVAVTVVNNTERKLGVTFRNSSEFPDGFSCYLLEHNKFVTKLLVTEGDFFCYFPEVSDGFLHFYYDKISGKTWFGWLYPDKYSVVISYEEACLKGSSSITVRASLKESYDEDADSLVNKLYYEFV